MQYVFVPRHVVLRAEWGYSDQWIAFNSKTFLTLALSLEELLFLEELKCQALPDGEFEVIWDQVSPENSRERKRALIESGVIAQGDVPPPRELVRSELRILKPLLSSYLSSPTELELCLTRRCNQRCVHCNVSAVSERKAEKLPTDFWLNVLDQAEELRVLRVTLTGGEPFVRDGINDILRHLVAKPMGCIILTNATMITPEQMAIMKEGPVTLSVSIDGLNEEQHDGFRRSRGAFRTTIETLRLLRQSGIPFVVSAVLHQGNVQQAPAFLRLAEDVGANRLVVVPIAAVGRARSKHTERYFPSQVHMSEAIMELKRLAMRTEGLDVVIGNAEPSFKELTSIEKRYGGATAMSRRNPGLCKAGVYSMAIDEDGMAYSCLRGLQEQIHPIGSLSEQSLAQVWEAATWADFRSTSLPPVPCRVEELGRRV